MNVFLNTYAYLRNAEQIMSSENIFNFLGKIAALGYCIQQEQSRDYWLWNNLVASSAILSVEDLDAHDAYLFIPDIAPAVQAGYSAFLRNVKGTSGEDDLTLERYEFVACAVDFTDSFRGMNFTITLDIAKSVIILSVDERLLNATDSSERRDQWLDLARLLYQHFHPLFELPLNEDYGRFERRDEVEAGNVQWLRWFNFYSPELVMHFGRQQLLATPDAHIETLDDGGVVVIPHDAKTVAAHLHLRLPFATT